MNPLQRFRGTDAARLDDLAVRATTASEAVARSAAVIRALAGATGGSPAAPSASPPHLDELQRWLDAVAADARRRASLTRQPAFGPAEGAFPAGTTFERPVAPKRVSRVRSEPVLRDDWATGWHLQGYLGPGLAWRHVGTEHRTTTDVFDHGRGWQVRVTTEEERAVFDVEVGAGFGPKRFGGMDPRRYHDKWHTSATRREYLHDGRPVSRSIFEAVAGTAKADGE